MHIAINISNGIPYATVMTSVREGKSVKKKSVVYLGRVLDEERGIYKSAERGVFSYDLRTNTFGDAPADFVPQVRPENRGIYTQSDSPKKSSRNIWSLAVVSVDQRY